MENEQQTVAVIGGGVIGLTSAYQLQKSGFKVTIFDRHGIASKHSASFGNAGHLATEQVWPLAQPALLYQLPRMLINPLGPVSIRWRYLANVMPWFMRFTNEMRQGKRHSNTIAIKALHTQAIDCWQQLVEELECDELITLKGSVLTFESTSATDISKMLSKYAAQGVDAQYLSGKRLRQLAPGLSEQVTGALYFSQVGHTKSPQELCAAIEQGFYEAGGAVIEQHVQKIEPLGEVNTNLINIVTDDEQIHTFNKVVVATGAHGKSLVSQLGVEIPLETERGYHLMLPIKTALSCPVASNERQFIITPMTDGLRLAGTVEFAGLNSKPNYQRSKMLLTHAQALLSASAVPELAKITVEQLEQDSCWMGCRPSLPDSLPVISKCPNYTNVYYNFGHQHLGLTWGAISGELIRDIILGQPTTIDVYPYRINRFGQA